MNELEKQKVDLIDKAFNFIYDKHNGQKDDDGKDYVMAHLIPVGKLLNTLKASNECVVAGLLHDTIEDTDTTYDELKKVFGYKIADLVMEVSHEGTTKKGYYFPRLHTRDGILIKFADNMSNLSRMDGWGRERKNHHLRHSKFWKSVEGEK